MSDVKRLLDDGLGSIESWETRSALARRLDFEGMHAIRERSADCQTPIRHGTASQPVMDREALIRYIDWLAVNRLPDYEAAVDALEALTRTEALSADETFDRIARGHEALDRLRPEVPSNV